MTTGGVQEFRVRLGIVGACGRGGSFRAACESIPGLTVQAVCDTDRERLPSAAQSLGAQEQYTCYEEMLSRAQIDAVLVGTPMPLHVPQAIQALDLGLHVLSEVPAGVTVEECERLTAAATSGHGVYMMAENYLFSRTVMLVAEIARKGLFGEIYYAEGEYIHELKALNEITPWRRKWQTGIDGNTYPTHSLGPLLQWMAGDRVTHVCCAGSGRHYQDPRGVRYENQDTTVTLCRMKSGGLVKLRLDMLSTRPHIMNAYQLQGVDGAFESSRAAGEPDRVWLKAYSDDPNRWMDLRELETDHLPPAWREAGQVAGRSGHGGGDYFVLQEFVDSLRNGRAPLVGIHEAMDMTLPGLASQKSVLAGGQWFEVPDSRDWVTAAAAEKGVVEPNGGSYSR